MERMDLKTVIYESVQKYNILPLTSGCNVSCRFCSHKQNPHEVEVFVVPPLAFDEIDELINFLSPDRKIVIGESATRIMEGEPFTHPEFLNILRKLRERFPLTPLQITTNGSYITHAVVKELKELGNLEINLSLNSGSVHVRSWLMRDINARTAINGISALHAGGIFFHGSIVAVPWLTGWEDIKNTIDFLAQAGSQTIRAFIPGFTRFNRDLQLLPAGWEEELRTFLLSCRLSISTPLTIEPPILEDLSAEITGVIRGSKGQLAGLKPGMEILSINGTPPFSRVDAFDKVKGPGEFIITVIEKGNEKNISLSLNEHEKSGLVMEYDLSPRTLRTILKIIKKKNVHNPLILASKGGVPLLREALNKTGQNQEAQKVLCVENKFFGGTIHSAGLLTVDDFIDAIKKHIPKKGKPDLLILPSISFDRQGRDLCGVSYKKIIEFFSIEVQLI